MTSKRRRDCYGSTIKKLGPRVLSALQIWLWLLVFVFQNEFRIAYSIQPGYLDFDNLPETNFTCVGKVIGGYYADLETSCQMFHVCTIGQQDEPMDIKFLCLNGTVFDQETRVCERVDEVDCSKSERFYSLNLELYGSTAPPLIEPENDDDEENEEKRKEDLKEEERERETKRPEVEAANQELEEENAEEAESDEEGDYGDYTEDPPTTPRITTTTTRTRPTTTTTPTTKQTKAPLVETTTITQMHQKPSLSYGPPNRQQKPNDRFVSPQEFIYRHGTQEGNNPDAISFQRQSFANDGHSPLTVTTHNIEHHIEKKPHQSIVDKIFITSATPPKEWIHQSDIDTIDKYENYESNKHHPVDPRPLLMPPRPQSGPITFTLRNPSRPQGFKPSPTTQNPHSQLQSPNNQFRPITPPKYETMRPIQSYQPSERHEILYENRYNIPTEFTPSRHEYDHYHFDHKRSHEPEQIPLQLLVARNAPTSSKPVQAKPVSSTSHKTLMKSPPRIIVSASASVSDSNGKKLNYTVGNIVHEVKPILPINYDNYKESDLLFDPFYLDVPKLKKKRQKRSVEISWHKVNKRETIITADKNSSEMSNDQPPPEIDFKNPEPEENISNVTESPSIAEKINATTSSVELTSNWEPPEYVDDNYEPYIFDEIDPDTNNTSTEKVDDKFISSTEAQKEQNKTLDVTTEKPPRELESEIHKLVLFQKVQEFDPSKSKPIMSLSTTESDKQKKPSLFELENELQRQLMIFHQIQKNNALKNYELEMQLKKQKLESMFSFKPEEMRLESTTPSQMIKPPNTLIKELKAAIASATTSIPLTTPNPEIQYKLVKVLNYPNDISKSDNFSCSFKTFYKFYADRFDCRTFHLCSPGYNKSEFVEMLFQCDDDYHFDKASSTCVPVEKSICEA